MAKYSATLPCNTWRAARNALVDAGCATPALDELLKDKPADEPLSVTEDYIWFVSVIRKIQKARPHTAYKLTCAMKKHKDDAA